MSVPRLWPLLAFMFVPGVFAWWSGRRLVRKRDDPTLAERLLARAEHARSEEHTSELQSPYDLVCRLLLEKKKNESAAQPPPPAPPHRRQSIGRAECRAC